MNRKETGYPAAGKLWRPIAVLATFLLLMMMLIINAPGIQAGVQQVDKEPGAAVDCALLDNPRVREKMSGMFETRLLLTCGRANELGLVQNDLAEPNLVGTDVLVNDPSGDSGASRTQSETSIARNENTGTICSGYNDSFHGVTQGLGYTGFSSSTDGGATFTDHGPIGSSSFGDPSIIWRKSDGKFYIATLHSSGLGMWRSDDDCTTFGTFVSNPNTSGGDDKELLAVDNNPGSPYYGRIYVAWIDFSGGARIYVKYTDNTTTWSPALAVSAVGADVQGAWPAVAPNGDLFVAWVRWNPYSTGPIDIEIVRSTNGGVSFTQVTNPLTGAINPRESVATASCGRPALKGNIRYLPSPQIVISPNGDLHVVYVYDPDGLNTGDIIDVFYRRSTDNGATWGPEVQLNDDGTTTDQFFPTISAGPSGRIVSTWYDRRLDPANNLLFDYYMRVSDDGGVTWTASKRVSDVSSPVILDPNLATCYHGDYDQQLQDGAGAFIQWSDDRTVVQADPNIWFDIEQFAPDFTLGITPPSQDICIPASAVYNVTIGSILGYTDPVTLSTSGVPAGYSSGFSVNPVTPPGASVLTLSNIGAASAGSYNIDVVGVAPTSTHTTTVALNLFDGAPSGLTLVSPANGATNVPEQPTYSWNTVAGAASYFIEVATDAGFTNIVDSATVAGTSYAGGPLNTSTTHYWRVTANNPCGSDTSAVWNFTTVAAPGDCGPGTVPNVLYEYGFEAGAGGWTSSGTGDTWALATSNPHSGASHYHANDPTAVSDQRLASPAVVLPTGQDPISLKFWHVPNLEPSGSTACYDGGILEVSTDGGTTWAQVSNADLLVGPYRGIVSSSFGNPLAGLEAWCGESAYFDTIADLSGYAGQTVQLRMRLGSDTSVSAPGWDVDDVRVQSCVPDNNTDPTITSANITTPIDENDVATLDGTFTDPDAGNSFTLTVDWRDGSAPEVFNYPAGTTSFSETHQYLDDDPTTGTPSDILDVDLLLQDNFGGSDTAMVQVTVNNLDPVVDAGTDINVPPGSPADFSGSFTDVGSLDTHTIEWDFGDGNLASGTLTPTHVYTATGSYTVTLTVTDDDTGVGNDEMVVDVAAIIYLPVVLNGPAPPPATSSPVSALPVGATLLLPAAVIGLWPLWRRRK